MLETELLLGGRPFEAVLNFASLCSYSTYIRTYVYYLMHFVSCAMYVQCFRSLCVH